MSILLVILAGLAYAGSACLLGLAIARQGQGERVGLVLAWIGLLSHCVGLAIILPLPGAGGIDLNFFHALSLVGAIMAALLLLLALVKPVISMGAALLPVVALTALGPFLAHHPIALAGQAPGLEAHIALALLSYSILGIAAVVAIGLAIQERSLRQHRNSVFLRHLPPLQSSERMLFQFIFSGWLLLTATLVTGWLFMQDLFAQSLAHKTILSLLSWLVFAVVLFGRWQRGWRGRVAIRFTLTGMGLLLLAYFGSKLVIELILQRPA